MHKNTSKNCEILNRDIYFLRGRGFHACYTNKKLQKFDPRVGDFMHNIHSDNKKLQNFHPRVGISCIIIPVKIAKFPTNIF